METQSTDELVQKKCVPCEGGVPKYSLEEARAQLTTLKGWRLTHDAQRIRKDWVVKNFMAGIDFFKRVAQIADGRCTIGAVAEAALHRADDRRRTVGPGEIDDRTHEVLSLPADCCIGTGERELMLDPTGAGAHRPLRAGIRSSASSPRRARAARVAANGIYDIFFARADFNPRLRLPLNGLADPRPLPRSFDTARGSIY